ncbi:MAG TPA: hypothetical protein VH063_06680 [Gaiellaceae bacterium]|nr:hypothetical protein [Gaiellaceae bacterium]
MHVLKRWSALTALALAYRHPIWSGTSPALVGCSIRSTGLATAIVEVTTATA